MPKRSRAEHEGDARAPAAPASAKQLARRAASAGRSRAASSRWRRHSCMPSSASASVGHDARALQHVGRAAGHRQRLGAAPARRHSAAPPAPGRQSPSPSSPAPPRPRCRRGWCRPARSACRVGGSGMRAWPGKIRIIAAAVGAAHCRRAALSSRQPAPASPHARSHPCRKRSTPCSTSPSRRRARRARSSTAPRWTSTC